MDIESLTGPWKSTYYYHEDADASSHVIDLSIEDGMLVGVSRPGDDDSVVRLRLEADEENALSGFWRERTASDGPFGGSVFHGTLQLLLDEAGVRAEGGWNGFNSDRTRVKSGRWVLERLQKSKDDSF